MEDDECEDHRERVLDREEAERRLPERRAEIAEAGRGDRAQEEVEHEPEQDLHVDGGDQHPHRRLVARGEGTLRAPAGDRASQHHDERQQHEPAHPGVREEDPGVEHPRSG